MLVLVSEVWGGFSPEAVRFLGELAQARGDRVDFERESATWSTTSFMSYHGQMLSLAVQLGVATEIQNSISSTALRRTKLQTRDISIYRTLACFYYADDAV